MSDDLITLTKDNIDALVGISRYRLDVHACPHFLDVFSFQAEEKLSEPWHYTVRVTCTADDIVSDSLLLKPASFTFQIPVFTGAPATPVRTVYGVVQQFQRLSTSADETHYALTIVPRIALLQHTRRSEIYLNQSVEEVVGKILREHGLEGADFEFRLSQSYPARELITQWRETDLEFIQRLLAEVGIFWRFEMDDRLEQDVIIFQDSPEQYQFGVTLPLIPPSRTSDNGQLSVWDIKTGHRVVSESVSNRDYNYREALTPQDSTASVSTTDGITTGEVYHYAEPFLSEGDPETPESGAHYARLRHERILNAQRTVVGKTTSPILAPGEVLEPQGALPAGLQDGIVITGVKSSGSRRQSFMMAFTGLPYSEAVCYRPPLHNRPVIAGTLPARVESTEKGDIYAWLDSQGRYRTRLDFDRSDSEQGYAYLWLRMAKPYAGDHYGFHAPLIDGTEVSVMFDAGDPDRPYIAHAQHDSENPDHVTSDNHTRNVLRTPANNKLRLEDKRQEEHIKLATEYGKTQLNIGHLVDAGREQRGTGFELRTDEFGAVRAARGIYLTADAQNKGQGPVLEMNPAVNRIEQANSEMAALNGAAQQAEALTCDIQTQNRLIEARLKDLQSAVVLASAPQGVAVTSGEHLQLTSAKNTMITAGQHVDIGAMKNVTVSAEKSLGLFAHKAGAKIIANLGNVEVRAQHNTLEMSSEQEFTVTSSKDEITISTPKTLTLNGGGSYLKLSESGIEHGTKGEFITKASRYQVPGTAASKKNDVPVFEKTSLNIRPLPDAGRHSR